MGLLGVPATARASFAAHSDASDIEALVRGLHKVKRIFG
jgi:cysteine desulfurase/selenocysteine lyase